MMKTACEQDGFTLIELLATMLLLTIGLLGTGGKLTDLVDVAVVVPSKDTQHVQEVLLAIEHAICLLVERALFRA